MADDEEAGEVVYELGDWDPDRRVLLSNALNHAGIPHVWETGDLVVNERDEARVEAMVDELDSVEPLEVESLDDLEDIGEDDGGQGVEAMGRLFVAADRLLHSPGDERAADDLADATELVAGMAAPFGIEPGSWAQIAELAAVVRDELKAEAGDEVVAADAKALREVLRRFV